MGCYFYFHAPENAHFVLRFPQKLDFKLLGTGISERRFSIQ